MKRAIGVILVTLMAVIPSVVRADQVSLKGFPGHQKGKIEEYRQKQKKENLDFICQAKDLTPEQRARAFSERLEAKYKKHKEHMFERRNKHVEKMVRLKERLAENTKFNEALKAEILAFAEDQYRENTTHHNQQFEEKMNFLKSIVNDSQLTPEQKRQAIKEYMSKQKIESKKYRKYMKEERQDFKEKIKSEGQDQKPPQNT